MIGRFPADLDALGARGGPRAHPRRRPRDRRPRTSACSRRGSRGARRPAPSATAPSDPLSPDSSIWLHRLVHVRVAAVHVSRQRTDFEPRSWARLRPIRACHVAPGMHWHERDRCARTTGAMTDRLPDRGHDPDDPGRARLVARERAAARRGRLRGRLVVGPLHGPGRRTVPVVEGWTILSMAAASDGAGSPSGRSWSTS